MECRRLISLALRPFQFLCFCFSQFAASVYFSNSTLNISLFFLAHGLHVYHLSVRSAYLIYSYAAADEQSTNLQQIHWWQHNLRSQCALLRHWIWLTHLSGDEWGKKIGHMLTLSSVCMNDKCKGFVGNVVYTLPAVTVVQQIKLWVKSTCACLYQQHFTSLAFIGKLDKSFNSSKTFYNQLTFLRNNIYSEDEQILLKQSGSFLA